MNTPPALRRVLREHGLDAGRVGSGLRLGGEPLRGLAALPRNAPGATA